MACNVFGTPVTNETLEKLPEYHDTEPCQIDRARVALDMKNAQGKDMNARKFLEIQQQRYGDKAKTVTMCLIYNATGNPLMFSNYHYWHGRVGESPMPARIENGQWGAFVHGNWYEEDKSRAAVVYSANIPNCRGHFDWLLCWSTEPMGPANQVYTDIGEPGSFNDWNAIDEKLKKNHYFHKTNDEGAFMFGSIGNSTNSVVEGIFTLSHAWFARD